MGGLTLVPEGLARVGYTFTFLGPNRGEECVGCPYQRICFSLEAGRTYRVKALRGVVHPCNLHDGGKVRVVEAEEADIVTSLEQKHLRGTAATWRPPPCGMPECPRYGLCHPTGPAAGARYEIKEAGEALPCPAGYELVRARLRRL